MFKWETIGKRTFKNLPDNLFKPTKGITANQGLYNGFLSAGLIWALFIEDKVWSNNIAVFFLSCLIIAGLYGAITITKKIFFVQAIPAIVVIILILY
jgi:putative membrane protein